MSGITICLEPDIQRDMVLGQYCVCTCLSMVTKEKLEADGKIWNTSHLARQTCQISGQKETLKGMEDDGFSEYSGGAWVLTSGR